MYLSLCMHIVNLLIGFKKQDFLVTMLDKAAPKSNCMLKIILIKKINDKFFP